MEDDGKVGGRVLRIAFRLPDGSVTVTTVDLDDASLCEKSDRMKSVTKASLSPIQLLLRGPGTTPRSRKRLLGSAWSLLRSQTASFSESFMKVLY